MNVVLLLAYDKRIPDVCEEAVKTVVIDRL